MNRFPSYSAGQKVKLTNDLTVTIGKMVDIDHHPSGSRFNKSCIVVKAYRSNGKNFAQVVSILDDALRSVLVYAEDFADH